MNEIGMFFVYTTIVSLPILCFAVKCLCEHTFMEFISLNAATLSWLWAGKRVNERCKASNMEFIFDCRIGLV